jgi:RNA polymerase sigma-54 factor
MNLKFDLNISQSQKLVMTQEMRQSIEILQLTAVELNGLIQKEMMENPVLELNEVSLKEGATAAEVPAKEETPQKEEMRWDEYFQSMETAEYRGQAPSSPDPDDDYGFEKFSTNAQTLSEYLHLQFGLVAQTLSDKEKLVGEYLIDCIDDNGYLLIDESYIKELLELDEATIERLIAIIQGFDPIGVGARDIEECLLIQLRQMGYEDDEVYLDIIRNHLEALADKQYKRIAQATGLTVEEVYDFKEVLKTLEPKPGREFSGFEGVSYVTPDGSIEIVDGELVVKINEVSAPRLRISNYYKSLLKNSQKNDEIRVYLEKKLDGANFLIKSIEQRRDTIRKVIGAIAEYQRDFFFMGVEHLRPLTLKAVAEMVEVHESTVSRAIHGKFIQTPKGTFALKFFFKRGFVQGAEDKSSDAIKRYIKEMIDAENKKKPLSDQKIAELLGEKNLNVARRTVAKYREALLIQPSSKRKEYA